MSENVPEGQWDRSLLPSHRRPVFPVPSGAPAATESDEKKRKLKELADVLGIKITIEDDNP